MSTFVDPRTSFDLLNHAILLEKLGTYAVGGRRPELIKNYLINRAPYANISEITSVTKPTNIGVPQGFIIGSFFFLIFINDLPAWLKMESGLYADDTNRFISNRSVTELYAEVNYTLQ